LYLAIGVTGASLSAILIRFSGEHPLIISFYRLFFASLMLMPLAVRQMRREPLPLRTLAALVGVGGILAVHFALWITSVHLTTVASATILVCCHPLLVVPLGQRLSGEGLPARAMVGVGAAFAGIVLLGYGGFLGGTLLGDMAALGAGVAVAFYIMAGRKARSGGMGLFTYAWIVYFSCSMFTLLVLLLFGRFTTSLPPEEWAIFIALAIIPTILGHTLINASLKYIKGGVVSTAILAEPVIATVLALLIFAEIPPTLSIIGGVLSLVGVAFVVLAE